MKEYSSSYNPTQNIEIDLSILNPESFQMRRELEESLLLLEPEFRKLKKCRHKKRTGKETIVKNSQLLMNDVSISDVLDEIQKSPPE